jgi:hypothetical protein
MGVPPSRQVLRAAIRHGRPIPPPRESYLKWQDAIALLALILAVAAMLSENNAVVAVCLGACWVILCLPVIWHPEIPREYRFVWCVLSCFIWLGIFSLIQGQNLERELARNEGVLEPGSESFTPPKNCQPPVAGAVAFLLGPATDYILKSPQPIIAIGGKQLLTIETEKDKIRISLLRLFDKRGDIFARIDENGFWIRTDIRKKHKNRSSLTIYDSDDNEALNLNFRNPTVISLTGIFRLGGAKVAITPDLIDAGTIRDHGSCTLGPAGVFRSGP